MSLLSAQEEEFARPCPRDGYYDVFISFRGKDTRFGFTDTLYHLLLGSKVYTFIDADLTGNVIETLFEIIGRSRMAVVIYSEKFASSHWCLTELELIMRQWEEKKMMMIPVFYKVHAHEVKHPTEKTIKYFDEHLKNYDETIVRKWKDAITKMGNVSGCPYKDVYGRSERDFIITQVIVTVKKKLREWRETNLERSTSKPYNNNNNSSSSTITENYDVFISFLGKDTRYEFVSHLYKALINYRRDIKIFMVDRDLLKDDSIVEVIQRSKMSVIVFSQNYTSSKWCLRELTKIIQCNNTTGQELLPIFYEITQPDLIKQIVKGRIANHLQKHARNEESETVQSWRNAIIDLGNMVGWRYSTTHNNSPRSGEECPVRSEEAQDNLTLRQEEQQVAGYSSTQSSCTHTTNTTTGDEQQVYRVVTSTYFQKSTEFTGDLLSVKPISLFFLVEPEKESSTLLIFSNNTDDCVAYLIQCTTEPLKYRVCPSEGLVLPHSTCQVIVTMEAQSTVEYPTSSKYMECSEKFFVQSVIAENGSYNSTNDFSGLFKKESGNTIDKWWMKVFHEDPPKRLVSVRDHHSQFHNKGFILKSMLVSSIDTHPTKPWLLLSLFCGSVCIWNYETRAEENSFIINDAQVFSAKFIHKKHWIVVGASAGFVHVLNYNTSEKVKKFKAHEGSIICMAVHPTSPYVLTTSRDKLVKLWNWENDWACIKKFKGHSNTVMQVTFNPKDSRSFASASQDGTIKLWSFDSPVPKFTINAHAKGLNCVEYFVGNDNKLFLLSGCDDYSAKVWDYESKTIVKTLEGHWSEVQATLVHPKIPIIITGSMDKTIHIWNKNTHRLELEWNCDLGQVWSMRFIETSNEVVLGCNDGMVVIKIVKAGT